MAQSPAPWIARSRWWHVSIIPLGLATLGGTLWMLWPGSAAPPGTKVAAASDQEPGSSGGSLADESAGARVEVVRPMRGGIKRQTIQPGSILAYEMVDLYAKVSGYLKRQTVDIGSPVKKGDVLAEIDAPEVVKDDEEAAAAVEQAKARAAQAQKHVATAEAERNAAAAAVAQAEADIDRYAALRRFREKELERIKGLAAARAVDRRLVDEQQTEYESALAAERAAKAAVLTAEAQRGTAEAKVEQARADVVEAQAAIRVAEVKRDRAAVYVGFTRIVAPFDGVVTRRQFDPGAFIRSAADGQPVPLLTVARTDVMRVVVQVPETDVAQLDVGDPVTIANIGALPGQVFRGTVARRAEAEDPTTRAMRMEIDLPNPSRKLTAGMYGYVTIDLYPASGNLEIPVACLNTAPDRGQSTVFVVRDGRAYRTTVSLGQDDGVRVEVLSGLKADDDVVKRALGTLEDGAPVTIVAGGAGAKAAAPGH